MSTPRQAEAVQSVDLPEEGRRRVVIRAIEPSVEGGRFPIKRVIRQKVVVEADVFADGHDEVVCQLLYRTEHRSDWQIAVMEPLGNDRWRAGFRIDELADYFYTIRGWVDPFATWARDLRKRVEAGQDTRIDCQIGADLVAAAAGRAGGADAEALRTFERRLRQATHLAEGLQVAEDVVLRDLMMRHADLRFAVTWEPALRVQVDDELAACGAWYEFFPRSCSPVPQRHGTFADCEPHLRRIAAMGFDVVYLPPIHPIGRSFRKGRNNAVACGPGDVGSPWAIGSAEGGHRSVHPELGTLEDFRRFVARARELGLEVALDLAYQCSPDHPYVREHPEWFRRRPDGTIQYAENPPKKYQDIYPFDFETPAWRELWQELAGIVEFWLEQGVRIFRVDNPHTKPLAFWEWLIRRVRSRRRDVIFLSEAFTRPKIMYRLAQLGFTQSYTYFTWRNTKWELTEYFTELASSPVREFFRPSLWPNTPDILHAYLQQGGPPAFRVRLVLAATLCANYGIYGPAFELCENTPREPGSEEYLNSEKYELKHWDIDRPDSLAPFIARVNRIRRHCPALQRDEGLRFHAVDNDQLLCYSRWREGCDELILVVVNLDVRHTQSGWVELPLAELQLHPDRPYEVRDLLNDATYRWRGPRNFVQLDPRVTPAHIFRVERLAG